MGWLADKTRYSRKVYDPSDKTPDGERVSANVEFRVLNAGDRLAIASKASKIIGKPDEDGEEFAPEQSMDMAAFQFGAVRRAVVSWDLPFPVSEATLRGLHPDVFDQLFAYVSFGDIPDEIEDGEGGDPLPHGDSQSSGETSSPNTPAYVS